MSAAEFAAGLVALNSGQLVGRTRLQKTGFLLDRCGANSGLTFEYRHYGTFSAELAQGWDDARAEGWLRMESRPGRRAMPYTIFRASIDPPEELGQMEAERARSLLQRMQGYSDIVLELAAAIVYLREQGYSGEAALSEVKVRKPSKATVERMELARNLLRELGLD